MEHSEKTNFTGLLKKILVNNAVTILFVVICIAGIVLAHALCGRRDFFQTVSESDIDLGTVGSSLGRNGNEFQYCPGSYGGTDRNYGFYEFFCNRGSRTRFGFYSQCSALTVFWKSDRTLI